MSVGRGGVGAFELFLPSGAGIPALTPTGDPGQGPVIFEIPGTSRGGDAAGGLCGDAADLYPGQKDGAQADLAAGTITVLAEDGRFLVHTLDKSLGEGIEDCEFQRRLEKLEA